MKNLQTSILIIASSFMLANCGEVQNTPQNSAPAPISETPPAPFDELATGRSIFEQACSRCHKDDGSGGEIVIEGNTLDPADLRSEHVIGLSDDDMIGTIYNGKADKGMPSFKTMLGEAQIREVVSYVRRGIQNRPTESLPMKPAR